MKKRYYKIIAALVGVIILLIIIIATKPPKVQTKIVEIEVEKEKIVEVEVEKIVEIEKEIEVIVEVEKEPEYKYNITSVEREMLARLVYLEGGIESLECQKAICSVIINRWQDGYWGDTIEDVIYAKHQFSPSGSIWKTTPTETNYQAVDYVLKNGCTIPSYVMFFRASYHFTWDGYEPYTSIDRTYFGYLAKDKI